MESLDPCIGIAFLVGNSQELRQINEAFSKTGKLANLANIYNERP